MTVRQLKRALEDFDPSATVTLDPERLSLLVGKGFYLDVPVAKKSPKREAAPIPPQAPPPEPGLFTSPAEVPEAETPGETKVN